MARTITFQPGDRMGAFIEELVKSGDYNNQSEVIRAAVRLLEEQTAQSSLSKIRQLIDDGDNSPDVENWSMDSLQKRLDNRHG
ncbi:type II toxin-antitoxin system ParD family antitoxin [Catenovulum sp. SX2]|uniref:type II toxin-antitoxin system ParD family antitoxin n=1 Tax=Catenovulum sp. SX2 TaxID=3398614 RepID=UPI003F87B4D0